MTRKQEWLSLVQVSLELERGNTYVDVWLRWHSDELPSGMLIEVGKTRLISEDGIEQIKNHIEKEGVLVSNQTTHEDYSLEAQLLGFTLSSYYFTISGGEFRGTCQLAQPGTTNGSEAAKIKRWQGISGKVIHDGKNALLVDDDEQLDEKELARQLEENGKSVEEVRKAALRKTLKRQIKLEPIKLGSQLNRKNGNQNTNKSAKLKPNKPIHQYKQIKTELLFFGESFLEGFLDFYRLEVNNALGHYEKNLYMSEIQDLSCLEKEYYLATTNKQNDLRIATEPLPSQQVAQRELDKFYKEEPKQEEYVGLTNAQKREEDES